MASRLEALRLNAVRLAAILVVGIVGISSVTQGRTAIRVFQNPSPDTVGDFDARLAELRPALANRATVGWFTDQPRVDSNYNVTQYGLVPVIVRRTMSEDLIVGFFIDPAVGNRLMKHFRLEAVRDFGDGLFLLRHRSE